ncbi:MAG: tRNA threonylcarbamoyladenosine dehydratase [Lachnospiraceae bacterium]|nr:tRNA threonylcarbamoyladenosine dehydratase [Lachnospiraceae bacterium]
MLNQYSRLEFVLGPDALATLRTKRVAIFGIGGVGGSVVEALARCGVGTMDLIDDDKICLTNINRQVLATRRTVGKYKVDVAEERIHDIDPTIVVNKYKMFYLPDRELVKKPAADQTAPLTERVAEELAAAGQEAAVPDMLDFARWDYVVDAIDTVTGKLGIILEAQRVGVPVISCMGCGNRLDPTKLTVCDIYETKTDPLARVMRYELRKRGVKHLTVVYSTEPAIRPMDVDNSCLYHCICPPGTTRRCTERRDIPGSTAFVPPAAGMIAASVIVRELTDFDPGDRVKGGQKNPKNQKIRDNQKRQREKQRKQQDNQRK